MRHFSRRESEILDCLYARGEASAAEVHHDLDNAPGYDSVRTILRILTSKGAVTRRKSGKRYIYAPRRPDKAAWRGFAARLAGIFFDGSKADAALALLDEDDAVLSPEHFEKLEGLIARHGEKRHGR